MTPCSFLFHVLSHPSIPLEMIFPLVCIFFMNSYIFYGQIQLFPPLPDRASTMHIRSWLFCSEMQLGHWITSIVHKAMGTSLFEKVWLCEALRAASKRACGLWAHVSIYSTLLSLQEMASFCRAQWSTVWTNKNKWAIAWCPCTPSLNLETF